MDTWAKEQVNPVGLTQVVTPANNAGLQGVGTSSDPLQFCANNLPTTPSATGDKIVVSSTARPCGELRDQSSIKAFTANADTGTSNINLGDNLAIIGDTDTKVKTAITAPNTLKVGLDTTGATLGQVPTVNAIGGITYSSPTVTDDAIEVNYDNTATSAPYANVQEALDTMIPEIATLQSNSHPAATVTGGNPALTIAAGQVLNLDLDAAGSYANAGTTLAATSVQDAITELALLTDADNGISKGSDGKLELGGTLHKVTTIDTAGLALKLLNLPLSTSPTLENLAIDMPGGDLVRTTEKLTKAFSIASGTGGIVNVNGGGNATFNGLSTNHINTTYTNIESYPVLARLQYSMRAHLFPKTTQTDMGNANFPVLQIAMNDICTIADINGQSNNFTSLDLTSHNTYNNILTSVNGTISFERIVRLNAGQSVTFTSTPFLSAVQISSNITTMEINTGFDSRATLTITPTI